MHTKDILCIEKGPLGLIVLNRPKALNALNDEMIEAMHIKLDEWATNPAIKVVLIKGAGEKAFCAGGDIKALYEAKQNGRAAELPHFYADEYKLNHAISVFPKPYIAFLDGITMGGGAGLSIHGQYRVGTEKLVFAMPETTIGFFPDVGGGYFLSRLPHNLGMYLGLTGEKMATMECKKAGLITHLMVSAERDAFEQALIDADWTTTKVEDIIAKFNKPNLKPQLTDAHYALIESCFSGTLDEIFHKLENHTHPWAKELRATLAKKSPLSLLITHMYIQKSAHLSLKEVLQLDLNLCHHYIHDVDFFEGIRSLLIDKDQNPQWKFKEIKEVPADYARNYFESPSNAAPLFPAFVA